MKYMFTAFFAFLLFSCSKSDDNDQPALEGKPASIKTWRYPCGPSCDALAWVIVLPDGSNFEAEDLPESFRTQEQDVFVTFRKTGKRNAGFSGTGLELVTILQIRKL